MSVLSSSACLSSPSRECSTNLHRSKLFALALVCLLAPMLLLSCSDRQRRDAGRDFSQGAFDGAKEFLNSPEADKLIDAKVSRGVEAGQAAIRAEFKQMIDVALKASEEGDATWWQLALLASAGYPVARAIRLKLWPTRVGVSAEKPSSPGVAGE